MYEGSIHNMGISYKSSWNTKGFPWEKEFSRGVSTSVGIPFRCFKKQRENGATHQTVRWASPIGMEIA